MRIADFELGYGRRPMIIAELGAAHNGNLSTALHLVETAKACGADACKIQAFLPSTITLDSDAPEFIIPNGPWKGQRLWDLYTKAHMPRAWFAPLFARAAELDIPLFASVFSIEDLDFIKQFDPPAYKIASLEMGDRALVKAVADEGRPVIISTGTAQWDEIRAAAPSLSAAHHNTIWLHCISSYPVETSKADMLTLGTLRRQFSHVGLSDHSRGDLLGIMAAAMGAVLVEKHLTLTPNGGGLDDGFASGPDAFELFVDSVHAAHEALGYCDASQPVAPRADVEHLPLRRSLYVVENVARGQMLNTFNVRSIRPGAGLAPELLSSVIGKRARRDIAKGTALQHELIEDGNG